MEVFRLNLEQMLVLFGFMVTGFILRKTNVLDERSQTAVSRLATFIFSPALVIENLINNCTTQSFAENSPLILCGAAVIAAVVLLSYPATALMFAKSEKTPENAYRQNVFKYSFAVANYGYIGNVLMKNVWGDLMFYKFTLFTLPMTFASLGWGPVLMIPEGSAEKSAASILKRLANPPLIGTMLGFVLGLTGLGRLLPGPAHTLLNSAGACLGPVCMMLAGMVIGNYKIGSLFGDKKVFLMSALRLVLIPAAICSVLMLLGAGKELICLALVAYATPSGMNSIVFPAAYGSDTKPGAAMVLITNALAVATLPLMYLVFVVTA